MVEPMSYALKRFDMSSISEPAKDKLVANTPPADGVIFFGASGDLAYKKTGITTGKAEGGKKVISKQYQ
jgi:hypothetical protein